MWDTEEISTQLRPNEFGLADKGYEGANSLLTPWKGKPDELHKRQKFVSINTI